MTSTLLNHLYELLLQCLEVGTVPLDMHDANSIMQQLSWISLLRIVRKAFVRVVLKWAVVTYKMRLPLKVDSELEDQ